MDVRCERCKTLYELDEARVSDAGTTVRCTSCGHVFRVRKKVLLMTEDVGAGGESAAVPPPIVEKPPWRVRSPNGRVIAFRELTSMQKWIVERKFGRDDEISLHGDHWKRLGDIAELQPFFLLLEEVDRVHELEERLRKYELPDEAPSALERALSPLAAEPVRPTPTPTPIRLDAPIQAPPEPASGNGFAAMGAVPAAGPEASGGPERLEEAAPPAPWTEPPRTPPPSAFSLEDIREATRPSPEDPPMPEGTVEPRAPAEEADQPEFTRRAGLGVGTNVVQDTDDWEPARPSSKAPWVAAVLIVGAIAVAAAAYFQIWVPAQEEKLRQEAERARVDQSQQSRAAEDADVRERERKAKEELVAGMAARADAGTATSTAAVADAGTGGSPPAEPPRGSTEPPRGSAPPVAPVTALARTAPPPGSRGRSFDEWVSQGDRERERARPRKALDAYNRAIRLEPSRPEAYVGQGRALLVLGDSRSAITAFRRALGANSRYSVAEFWLGEAYRRAGQKSEAAAAYGRYLEAAPEGAEAAQAREALNGLP